MMEFFLKLYGGEDFEVESAGIHQRAAEGHPANPHSQQCMEEHGFDISKHTTRWIGDLDLNTYDVIVCVGENEADAVRSHLTNSDTLVTVANAAGGGIPNPYEKGMEEYRQCYSVIDASMREIVEDLRA